MLTFRGTVQYTDGESEEFECGTAALAAYELYAMRNGFPVGAGMPPTLGSMVIAHHALNIAEGFETWRKTVSGVELNADGVNPTPPEASEA